MTLNYNHCKTKTLSNEHNTLRIPVNLVNDSTNDNTTSDTNNGTGTNNLHTKTTSSQLKLLLWNARSLNKQINDFQSYVYSETFDIIAITETWLTNNIYTNEIFPSGYRVLNYFWAHFTHNFNSERACTYHFLCPCYRCSKEPIITNFNKL